jgi:hypothetical protein
MCAILLPYKVCIHIEGEFEGQLNTSAGFHMFMGLIGCGISYWDKKYYIKMFFCFHELINVNITSLINSISRRGKKKKEKPCEENKGIESFIKRIRFVFTKMHNYKQFFRPAIADIKEMFRVNHLECNIKFGLGNPALTGYLVGVLYMINGMIPKKYKITPSWNFTRRIFQGELSLTITIRGVIVLRRIFLIILYLIIKKLHTMMRNIHEPQRRLTYGYH